MLERDVFEGPAVEVGLQLRFQDLKVPVDQREDAFVCEFVFAQCPPSFGELFGEAGYGEGSPLELELRYRGLRAPHKIKAAVSGCTRECAEARSKDVGVIATEAGGETTIINYRLR